MPRQSQRLRWTFTINNYEDQTGIPTDVVEYMIEAHEVGASGTPHIQGFCILKEAKTLNQMKEYCPTAHFEATRATSYQNYLYCAKGEQTHTEWMAEKETGPNWGKNAIFVETGTRPTAPINAHKKKPQDTTYAEALAAGTVREGLDIVKKRKARDYCLHGESIEGNLKRAKALPPTNSKFLLADFNRAELDLTKAVLLCGKSNTGKTQWALAHFKNPLFVTHVDKLKKLNPDHDGIVFDDMSFTHWPAEGVIHLLDMDCEREIHARYGNITIPAGVKKIFTTNKQNPFYTAEIEAEQKNAIERRYTRITVDKPLFGVDTIFDAVTVSAFDQMVGAHKAIPQVVQPPEKWSIHEGCAPLLPLIYDDPDDEMNQVD